jgi:hypothetical protein
MRLAHHRLSGYAHFRTRQSVRLALGHFACKAHVAAEAGRTNPTSNSNAAITAIADLASHILASLLLFYSLGVSATGSDALIAVGTCRGWLDTGSLPCCQPTRIVETDRPPVVGPSAMRVRVG